VKKFGFRLEDELYEELKSQAELDDTSMAAICRNALREHLSKSKQPLKSEKGPSTWENLMAQVAAFLDTPAFLPETTPDAIPARSPFKGSFLETSREVELFQPDYGWSQGAVPNSSYNTSRPNERWLDEIWA
jgi:hypothetical protein